MKLLLKVKTQLPVSSAITGKACCRNSFCYAEAVCLLMAGPFAGREVVMAVSETSATFKHFSGHSKRIQGEVRQEGDEMSPSLGVPICIGSASPSVGVAALVAAGANLLRALRSLLMLLRGDMSIGLPPAVPSKLPGICIT